MRFLKRLSPVRWLERRRIWRRLDPDVRECLQRDMELFSDERGLGWALPAPGGAWRRVYLWYREPFGTDQESALS